MKTAIVITLLAVRALAGQTNCYWQNSAGLTEWQEYVTVQQFADLTGWWVFDRNPTVGQYLTAPDGSRTRGSLLAYDTAVPTWSTNYNGTLVFDGSNDYLTNSAPVIPVSNSTVLVSFRYTSNAKIECILSQYTAGTAGRFGIMINQNEAGDKANNTLYVFGATALTMSVASLSVNTWYVACVTQAGASAVLYVNGVQRDTGTPQGIQQIPLMVGRFISSSYSFTGSIGEVLAFNRALASNEVHAVSTGILGRLK